MFTLNGFLIVAGMLLGAFIGAMLEFHLNDKKKNRLKRESIMKEESIKAEGDK